MDISAQGMKTSDNVIYMVGIPVILFLAYTLYKMNNVVGGVSKIATTGLGIVDKGLEAVTPLVEQGAGGLGKWSVDAFLPDYDNNPDTALYSLTDDQLRAARRAQVAIQNGQKPNAVDQQWLNVANQRLAAGSEP